MEDYKIILEREHDTVKRFSVEKAYGFTSCENGEKDILIHFRAITIDDFEMLLEGQKVAFQIMQRYKGPQAQNVSMIKSIE